MDSIICGFRRNDLFGKEHLRNRNDIIGEFQKRNTCQQFNAHARHFGIPFRALIQYRLRAIKIEFMPMLIPPDSCQILASSFDKSLCRPPV